MKLQLFNRLCQVRDVVLKTHEAQSRAIDIKKNFLYYSLVFVILLLVSGCIPRIITCRTPYLRNHNKKALKKTIELPANATTDRMKLYSITENDRDGLLFRAFLLYADGTARMFEIPQRYNIHSMQTPYQEMELDTVSSMTELEKFNLLLNSRYINMDGVFNKNVDGWGNWYLYSDTLRVAAFEHSRMCYSKVFTHSFVSVAKNETEWQLVYTDYRADIGTIFKSDTNFATSDSTNYAWRYWK